MFPYKETVKLKFYYTTLSNREKRSPPFKRVTLPFQVQIFKSKKDNSDEARQLLLHSSAINIMGVLLDQIPLNVSHDKTKCNKRELKWYKHVITINNLSTTILQYTILGKRRNEKIADFNELIERSFAETRSLACTQDMWRELIKHSAGEWPCDSTHSWDRYEGNVNLFDLSSIQDILLQ